MWCDTFDADLLEVVPGAAEALGDAAPIELRTYSRLTDGKINHPACWNTDHGTAAFFWTGPGFKPPAEYYTDLPETGCTLPDSGRWHGGRLSGRRS